MNHHFPVRILTGFGVLNGLDYFDVVTTGTCICSTLSGTGVLRYFSHDAIILVTLEQRALGRIKLFLLDFAVYRYLPKNGVVLLELYAVGRVLTILLGYVTAGSWLTSSLVLGALKDDKVAVTFRFLSHNI